MTRASNHIVHFANGRETFQAKSRSPQPVASTMSHFETDGAKVLALWVNQGLTHRRIKKRLFSKLVLKMKRRIPTVEVDGVP
jgi:hypothetical protein